jgi:hypothetical protein
MSQQLLLQFTGQAATGTHLASIQVKGLEASQTGNEAEASICNQARVNAEKCELCQIAQASHTLICDVSVGHV